MAFMRGVFAILAGILVTGIIGASYDYLRPGVILDPVNTMYLYPWITGLSGGLGGFVAVLVYSAGAARTTAERPAPRPRPVRQSAPVRTPVKPASTATSADVPGMPTFDFDKAKADVGKPKEKQ